MTRITTASGRKIDVSASQVSIFDRYGYRESSIGLSGGEARQVRDALVALVPNEDLFDKFSALPVGAQFTLLSDTNAARGVSASKAIKVDSDTYFSYKKKKVNAAAAALKGKFGTLTVNS